MSEESRELQPQETEKQEVQAPGVERTRDRPAFVPRADIYETDNEIVIVADMPGVDDKSLDITVENNVLTINGYVEPMRPENYNLAYAEYRVGDYARSFTLSNQIDTNNIDATIKNGVLHLRLAKIREAQTKKIPVKSG